MNPSFQVQRPTAARWVDLVGLAELSPGCFGICMATGIVSLAAQMLGWPLIARVLFGLNVAVYALLWCLTLLRMGLFPRRFFADMADHPRGPGFFTVVAATSVLGTQFIVIADAPTVGFAAWVLTCGLWLLLTYAIFAAFTVKPNKPALQQGINGAWLLAVVATQSVAVLSTLLAGHGAQPHRLELNFLALVMWLSGGMLYIWLMALIFYRCTFFALTPDELTPPYWINMGAMAISTLAGSLLVTSAVDAPFLHSLVPFIKGFTVFYWATGTWWIPLLLVLGVWRYLWRRHPLRYDPLYWSAVFPLGMYAAGTHQMIEALGSGFGFLQAIPHLFGAASLLAWSAAFAGLLISLVRRWRGGSSRPTR